MELRTQDTIDGRYTVLDNLGGGGMAEVYLARDEDLGREVALKVLAGRYVRDEELVERFRREARSAATLSHPNIVQIFDRGETEDGTFYIAMEYLPGGTLADYLSRRGHPGSDAASEVTLQVAKALREAHENGIVHRDIKPQNILITKSGDAKVADFGIALSSNVTSITEQHYILGTTNYMSPEQARGEPAVPASDLYSLGVVLYEMLTGNVPYSAETPLGVAVKHVNDPPPAPKDIVHGVPNSLNEVTLCLLEKNPEDRYASASELIGALESTGGPSERGAEAALPIGLYGQGPGTADPVGASPDGEQPAAANGQPGAVEAGSASSVRRHTYRRKSRRLMPVVAIAVLLIAALAVASPLGDGFFPDSGDSQVASGGDQGASGGDQGGSASGQEGSPAEGSPAEDLFGGERVEVPQVDGSGREQAVEEISEAGFEVETQDRESSPEEEGLVVSQSVPGGESASEGSTVELVVGGGPQSVEVPDLAGVEAPEAEAAIIDAGLEVGESTLDHTHLTQPSIPKNVITQQSLAAGEEVEPGSEVDLAISCSEPRIFH